MRWAGWPWLLMAAAVVAYCALRACRASGVEPPTSNSELPPTTPLGLTHAPTSAPDPQQRSRGWRLPALTVAILVVLLVGRDSWGVWPIAIASIALLLVQLRPWLTLRAPREAAGAETVAVVVPSQRSQVIALGASIAFGLLGCFLLRPDADDVYYVNRATWVARFGTAAINDTMFSPNVLPSAIGGGLPTPSVEALQGVVAHALGLQAPTMCYIVAVPLLGVLSGWTTWRLVRALAPRRQLLAFCISMVVLLAGAGTVVGDYSLGRIWQGKATAYAILMPLVWVLLTRRIRRPQRSDVLLLASAGVAFVGLTTTSALLGPIIVAAALLAAVLLRSRALAGGALAFAAAPVLGGLVQVLSPLTIGGADGALISTVDAFGKVFGTTLPLAVLGVTAVVLVPRAAARPAGVLLACAGFVTMVTLLPGVFWLMNLVTGAGPIAWRLLIAMPLWVLVGLLVTIPETRAITVAVSVISAAAVLIWGAVLWYGDGAILTGRPTWKVDQAALADVRAAQQREVPAGLWLMPPDQMEILAISAVGPFAVVPRGFYLPNLQTSRDDRVDRRVLLGLQLGEAISPERVRLALQRLDVSLACVSRGNPAARRILHRAVGRKLTSVGDMQCHIGPTGD